MTQDTQRLAPKRCSDCDRIIRNGSVDHREDCKVIPMHTLPSSTEVEAWDRMNMEGA